MAKQKTNPSAITRDCTNFKNYLKNQFEVENFGEFICTYTFPLSEMEALKKAAADTGKNATSMRLYYGCNADGTGHKLYMSLLDEEGEIIVDSSSLKPETISPMAHTLMAAAPDADRKCPPGGTSDRLIHSLFN